VRRVLPALTLAAGALLASRANADELRLSWRAPIGCPTSAHVRDAAVRTAARDGLADRGEVLEADAVVKRDRLWRVSLVTRRGGTTSAERTLEASSCDALAEATAVILALALVPSPAPVEPTSAAASGDPAASESPAADAAPASATPLDTASESAEHAAPANAAAYAPGPIRENGVAASRDGAYARRLAVSASLVTNAGSLPSAAVGGGATLAYGFGRGRLEVGGSYFAVQSKTTAASAAGARFGLGAVAARACYALARGVMELAPCVGAEVLVVDARGFGASANYDTGAAWVAATGGALLRVPVTSHLAARADASIGVAVTQPRFVVDGDGAVYEPARVGARAGIGAELLFF